MDWKTLSFFKKMNKFIVVGRLRTWVNRYEFALGGPRSVDDSCSIFFACLRLACGQFLGALPTSSRMAPKENFSPDIIMQRNVHPLSIHVKEILLTPNLSRVSPLVLVRGGVEPRNHASTLLVRDPLLCTVVG